MLFAEVSRSNVFDLVWPNAASRLGNMVLVLQIFAFSIHYCDPGTVYKLFSVSAAHHNYSSFNRCINRLNHYSLIWRKMCV